MRRREDILRRFGAGGGIIAELLEYNSSLYTLPEHFEWIFPFEDENFVPVWEGYERETREKGVFETLRSKLVQLSFSIQDGISKTSPYTDATLRGVPIGDIPEAKGLNLVEEERLELFLTSSAAGRLPVLLARNRSDFINLVRALAYRNEPAEVPESMGSLILAGYNNWDRLRSYREQWEREHPTDSWQDEFSTIASKKELYQDKFILLSDSPYSGVKAESLGMDEDGWKELSYKIRLGHELCHYFCKRVLLSMRNNALDELLADYCGIVNARGSFLSDWLLRFLGLEDPSAYRRGGRLENYTKDLSEEAFAVLCRIVEAAASNLEELDACLPRDQLAPYKVLMTLSFFTLEELASSDAVSALKEKYEEVQNNWRIRL